MYYICWKHHPSKTSGRGIKAYSLTKCNIFIAALKDRNSSFIYTYWLEKA